MIHFLLDMLILSFFLLFKIITAVFFSAIILKRFYFSSWLPNTFCNTRFLVKGAKFKRTTRLTELNYYLWGKIRKVCQRLKFFRIKWKQKCLIFLTFENSVDFGLIFFNYQKMHNFYWKILADFVLFLLQRWK